VTLNSTAARAVRTFTLALAGEVVEENALAGSSIRLWIIHDMHPFS